MQRSSPVRGIAQQQGALLLLTMLFMLILAVVAGAVIQTGVLEFHMAGNAQFREEAVQRAQAIATEISRDPANFGLAVAVGRSNCNAADKDPGCDDHSLSAPVSAVAPGGVELTYRVTRQAPLLLRGFPGRESQLTASGAGLFDAALFEISVQVDGSASRLGSARVVQGIAVRMAAAR
jgi:hypothetical protein